MLYIPFYTLLVVFYTQASKFKNYYGHSRKQQRSIKDAQPFNWAHDKRRQPVVSFSQF